MAQLVEENQESFKWGDRIDVGTDDSDIKVYKSFTYQGVQYSRFDCVYMYREGAKDTDIGKLIKLWESKKGGKRGKVVWFFRPIDVCHFLRDYEPSWNELFMASGESKGVSNIIPLEAIVGKCKVVCTAKDSRITLLSKSDLGKANYFVSHIFDVGNLRISDKFPDSIDMIKVERLFNWNRDKPKANVESKTGLTAGAGLKVVEKPTHTAEKPIKVQVSENFENRDKLKANVECRNGLIAGAQLTVEEKPTHPAEKHTKPLSESEYFEHHTSEVQRFKKRKIQPVAEPDPLSSSQQTRRWFCMLPWEERVKDAHELGTLVHLVNLEPSYTASDVQDIISKTFKVKVHAKIIPHRSSDVYGQALVIFESKDDADFVMCMLEQKCLVVGEARPLVAYKSPLIEPGVTCNFPGNLIVDKPKYKSNKRKAVFTSHCAQANTGEHEMAMQWCILQKKSDLWWEALHEEQAKEILPCLSQMIKYHQSDEPNRTSVVPSAPESPVERPHSASHPASL